MSKSLHYFDVFLIGYIVSIEIMFIQELCISLTDETLHES